MSARATRTRSPLIIIFVTVFIDLVGFGIVIPILPLYAERFGASPLVIGLLLSVYSMMQCLCAPLLGKLSDRVGRRPVLLLSILGTAGGFFVMGLAKTLPWLFVARIIDGITGGNISTAQAYIADVTPPEHRSKGMGLIGAAFGLGFIFGPAIGGLLSRVSLSAPFFFAAALAASNATALYFLLPESLTAERRQRTQAHPSIADVVTPSNRRPLQTILAVYFFTTVAFSLLTATYALFAEQRFKLTPAHIGLIFAGQGILGAMIQGGLLGQLLRVVTDKRLVVIGTGLLMISLLLLPISATLVMLMVVTAGIAIGHSLVAAPLNGLASKHVGASAQGRVLGLMQSAASFARIVGPVMGGSLLNYDALKWSMLYGRTPYWSGAAVMLVAFVLSITL